MNVEDFETFQRQALEINEPDEDFDPNAPIEDGDQYLTHMLHERRKCPAIIVRPFNNKKQTVAGSNVIPKDEVFELLGEDSHVVEAFRKTNEWKKEVYKQLINARIMIDKARKVITEESFDNSIEIPFSNESVEWIDFCKKHEPKLNILIRFNQRAIENLIEYLCDWLHDEFYGHKKIESDSGDESYITAASKDATKSPNPNIKSEMLSPALPEDNKYKNYNKTILDLREKHAWFAKWVYGTIAAIDKRLGPDIISVIRELGRLLILFRHRIDPSDQETATPYTLLILLISKVFAQLDLAAFV